MMFNFSRSPQACLERLRHFTLPPRARRAPFLHILQHLRGPHLVAVTRRLTVAVICISLTTDTAEHLFTRLLATRPSSERCLWKSFTRFLLGLSCESL